MSKQTNLSYWHAKILVQHAQIYGTYSHEKLHGSDLKKGFVT